MSIKRKTSATEIKKTLMIEFIDNIPTMSYSYSSFLVSHNISGFLPLGFEVLGTVNGAEGRGGKGK